MKHKVFVIGDSVSIHYGPYLKTMIVDKFDYDRKRGIGEIGRASCRERV